MPVLADKDRELLTQEFDKLTAPVRLVYFTQAQDCPYCGITELLVREIAGLSDKVTATVYDLVANRDVADQYGVDKTPAIVVERGGETAKDFGIRFYGNPSGYEFPSLIEAIKDVSSGTNSLTAETKAALATITRPVHIQVFITPTCPYCPEAVRLAHQMAVESEFVHGDMVESIEFIQLSRDHGVMGVPKTVVNETVSFDGAVPEAQFLAHVLKAAEAPTETA
jgi:glutaredoxin-like protein